MPQPVPPEVLRKVRKLALLPQEVRQSRWAVSITRLTILKSLCQEAKVANRFVTYLARKTLERVEQGKGRSAHPNTPEQRAHRQMMTEALAEMEAWMRRPTDERRQRLWTLLGQMRDEQNEYQNIRWGAVRNIHDGDLLLFEYALHCLLNPEREAGYWAYQTARHYAERYDSRHGTGLIPVSAPLVQDIADFWMQELGLDLESVTAPTGARKTTKEKPSSTRVSKGSAKAEKRLHALGIGTIGQLAALPERLLMDHFGEPGKHLWHLAHGEDERSVVPDREAKSVSTETIFPRDVGDPRVLRTWLLDLVEELAGRLRREGLRAQTVGLKLRSSDFRTRSRAATLPEPTDLTDSLWQAVAELFEFSFGLDLLPLRLLGVGASKLTRGAAVQGHLFEGEQRRRQGALDQAVDAIRGQFGSGAIQRGSLLDLPADHQRYEELPSDGARD